jgi:excisionase family DNA binding protein
VFVCYSTPKAVPLADGDFLSPDEAARRTGISARVIRQMLRDGRLDALAIGSDRARRWLIPETTVKQLAEAVHDA